MENANRRKALRVEEKVVLNIETIPAEQMGDIENHFKTRRSAFSLQSHLAYVSEQQLPSMRIIERKHPEIANYLKYLEKQIEFVSEKIIQKSESNSKSIDSCNIYLSASGIQFSTGLALEVNSCIELELYIASSNMHILTFAKIVRLQELNDGDILVSAEFSLLHEEDEEALIRHIHQIHVKQLRTD